MNRTFFNLFEPNYFEFFSFWIEPFWTKYFQTKSFWTIYFFNRTSSNRNVSYQSYSNGTVSKWNTPFQTKLFRTETLVETLWTKSFWTKMFTPNLFEPNLFSLNRCHLKRKWTPRLSNILNFIPASSNKTFLNWIKHVWNNRTSFNRFEPNHFELFLNRTFFNQIFSNQILLNQIINDQKYRNASKLENKNEKWPKCYNFFFQLFKKSKINRADHPPHWCLASRSVLVPFKEPAQPASCFCLNSFLCKTVIYHHTPQMALYLECMVILNILYISNALVENSQCCFPLPKSCTSKNRTVLTPL